MLQKSLVASCLGNLQLVQLKLMYAENLLAEKKQPTHWKQRTISYDIYAIPLLCSDHTKDIMGLILPREFCSVLCYQSSI